MAARGTCARVYAPHPEHCARSMQHVAYTSLKVLAQVMAMALAKVLVQVMVEVLVDELAWPLWGQKQ